MKRATKGASLISMGILIGLIAILAISGVSLIGEKIATQYTEANTALAGDSPKTNPPGEDTLPPAPEPIVSYESCNEIYTTVSQTSGAYYLRDDNGNPYRAWCVMKGPETGVFEGGWTTVLWNAPNTTEFVQWGSDIAADRPTETYTQSSFSLAASKIPPHAYMAYGFGHSDGSNEFQGATTGDYKDIITKLSAGSYDYRPIGTDIEDGSKTQIFSYYQEFSFEPMERLGDYNIWWQYYILYGEFKRVFYKDQELFAGDTDIPEDTYWAVWVR